MACYYLVISSAHLSNGHFRNIKGVFRGPIRKTAGNESPDYAEKETAIAKALQDLKANFYCELCDKQYHKHQEFDNHINSYDHAHKQRLKELKQREFARNVASKSWKDERKQERALRRLHQLAEQRQQCACGPGSGPKFRSTTVSAKAQHQDKAPLEKDCGPKHQPGAASKDKVCRCLPDLPAHREQPHSHKRASQSSCDYSRQRAGVSFCFSRKAQLKLESCASVFSDGVEEASDRQDLRRQTARQVCKALWSKTHSPEDLGADSREDEEPKVKQVEKAAQDDERKGLGGSQTAVCSAADEPASPTAARPGSLAATCLGNGSSESKRRPGPEGNFNEPDKSSCFAQRDSIGKDPPVDSGQLQKKGLLQESPGSQRDTEMINDSYNVRAEEECFPLAKVYIVTDGGQIKNHISFLNVLSKDGTTTLKWPTELLLYTKSEPYISYSCNPLYFDFKHSRNRHNSTKSTQAAGPDYCVMSSDAGEGEGRWSPSVRSQVRSKLGIPKPKRAKRHKPQKTRNLKSEAVGKLHAGSQTESGEAFECAHPDAPQNNKHARAKRLRFGKRKISVEDEASNKTDIAEHSQESFTNALSPSSKKRKKAKSLILVAPNLEFSPYSTHSGYLWDMDGSKRGHSLTSISEKSGYCSSFSDWNSDSEGGKYLSSSGSSYRSSSRRDSGCSQTHSDRPSRGWTHSSGRLMGDGSTSERRDTNVYTTKKLSRASAWPGPGGPEGAGRWRQDWKQRRQQGPGGWCCTNASSLSREEGGSPRPCHSTTKRAQGLRRSWFRPEPGRFSEVAADSRSHKEKSWSRSKDRLCYFRPPFFMGAGAVKEINDQASPQNFRKRKAGTPSNVNATHRPEERFSGGQNLTGRKVNKGPSLPLIGKFPAVKKSAKTGESSKTKSNLSNSKEGGVVDVRGGACCPRPQHPPETPGAEAVQAKEPQGGCELSCWSPQGGVISIYSVERDNIADVHHHQGRESQEAAFTTGTDYTEEAESPAVRLLKCVSPPLTEQPITFTPEEIEKYRLLQLQAQQHMQQQLEQATGPMQAHLEVHRPSPTPNPAPTFQLFPPQQPSPSLQHALLHHRALVAFASSLYPQSAHQHFSHNLHPLPQPQFAPISFSPMSPAAILSTHPATLLARRPLHFVPSHLTLHPLHPGSILPTLLRPATGTSTLHLHPILHPLFPGQDLQPHSGPRS